jgi:hypothetical protein
VLAHPPGTGKGHSSIQGLQAFLASQPEPGTVVWTGIRKEQINDQEEITLTPLHGRNRDNCEKFAEANMLSNRGYNVTASLCRRRCPHLTSCKYLAQFRKDEHFFATQDLLQSTGWWTSARVLVLDEFDPARLVRTITLNSANLAAMGTATTCPHTRALLRWVGVTITSHTDRTLTGTLLLDELDALARAEGADLTQTLREAREALPSEAEVNRLHDLPSGATLEDYATLPPNYTSRLVTTLHDEQSKRIVAEQVTSRLEAVDGTLLLHLRLDHVIAKLARARQPKIILDATANEALLRAIFPHTPLRFERPAIAGGAKVIQVITRDWAKSTLHGKRKTHWHDEVAAQIRKGRPTLVICTKACKADLQAALAKRGHKDVVVAHYGAVRGSNAYKGYDVILAQIYHPNHDAIIREGRALFAGQGAPLDERIVTVDRLLTDARGQRWRVYVPTFADERLAALLTHHREAELVQAALRGRPMEHPEAQITLLFGLPLESLPPTEIREGVASPESNRGRQAEAQRKLLTGVQQLLDDGKTVVGVEDIIEVTHQSPGTVRKYLSKVAMQLNLRLVQQRRGVTLPGGGKREYQRMVLVRRGRRVPPRLAPLELAEPPPGPLEQGIDHAHNKDPITCVIHRLRPATGTKGGRHRYVSRYAFGGLPKGARLPILKQEQPPLQIE